MSNIEQNVWYTVRKECKLSRENVENMTESKITAKMLENIENENNKSDFLIGALKSICPESVSISLPSTKNLTCLTSGNSVKVLTTDATKSSSPVEPPAKLFVMFESKST